MTHEPDDYDGGGDRLGVSRERAWLSLYVLDTATVAIIQTCTSLDTRARILGLLCTYANSLNPKP